MIGQRLPCDRRTDEARLADLNADLRDGPAMPGAVLRDFAAAAAAALMLACFSWAAAALWVAG